MVIRIILVTLQLQFTYTLSDENGLSLQYDMESDKDTLANLTNHSYFNMDGHDSGDVLSQKVWIDA